jgi:parvulin-like peptidyl-prolyl isomerase
MNSHKWILVTLLASSTMLSFKALATTSTNPESTKKAEEPKILLANVNGQPIYNYQLEPQIQKELKKYKYLNKSISKRKENIQNSILQKYINAELIHQASQKQLVDNMDKKVEEFIEEAKKNNYPIQNKEAIKRQIRINEYLKSHDLISPQPTEDEVRAFYERGKEQFVSSKKNFHVQHIFIAEKNKDKMETVKQQLSDGQPFKDVAKKYSEDENSSNKGGDLGFIPLGFMPKEFDDTLSSLKKGTLSDVVKTEEGYHIFMLLEVRPAGTIIAYEKIKDFLAKGLAPQTKERKVAVHLKLLKENAKIELFNQEK